MLTRITCAALLCMTAGACGAQSPSTDNDMPTAEGVTYTVTAQHATDINIYGMVADVEGRTEAINSMGEPIRTHVGPNTVWSRTVTLKDSFKFGYIGATSADANLANPKLSCFIAVDGLVEEQQRGDSGVSCTLGPR